MEPGEYDDLVAKTRSGSSSAAIELLGSMRSNKIHQPELVMLHGGRLLSTCPRNLGNEVWTVLEQVFFAAVELGIVEWRDYCLKQLEKKFPNSIRVERLKGIQKESMEDWNEAKKIYQKILKEKPEDTITQKRLIAMFKQRGKTSEAIEQLNTYLETFCVDAEVWHELAELYIEAGSLQRAVFCYEELMISNPRSMYHILTYAELLYSTGDFVLSRKYFSLAAYLDGNCLRALWGLVLCGTALAEKDKSKDMEQLKIFAEERLRRAYSKVGPHGALAIELISSGVS